MKSAIKKARRLSPEQRRLKELSEKASSLSIALRQVNATFDRYAQPRNAFAEIRRNIPPLAEASDTRIMAELVETQRELVRLEVAMAAITAISQGKLKQIRIRPETKTPFPTSPPTGTSAALLNPEAFETLHDGLRSVGMTPEDVDMLELVGFLTAQGLTPSSPPEHLANAIVDFMNIGGS